MRRPIPYTIAFLLLILAACTPHEPETAATIVVQRPTFTPTPLQPTKIPTNTPTALATPTLPAETTSIPTRTTPTVTTTQPPTTADEGDLPMPHGPGPTGPADTSTPTLTPPPGFDYWQLPECIPPADMVEGWLPCHLELLPDERWVILHSGPEVCGSRYHRKLVNLLTLESRELGIGSVFQVLPNGELIFSFVSCSGGHFSHFDPHSGEITWLGDSGRIIWNEPHTAFVVEVIHLFISGALWGYNVETNIHFPPNVGQNQVNDGVIWTPDNRYVLYQQTTRSYSDNSTFTATPREIYRLDTYSGEKQVIASDPQFHYFLCSEPCSWDGDWVFVRRITYFLEEYFANGSTDDPDLDCLLEGRECPGEQTFWQLNWRTGELRPLE
jgi:hypothetical protein